MQRREFVKYVSASAGVATLSSCGPSKSAANRKPAHRMLVLAFDGLDPRVLESLISAGKVPNLARLANGSPVRRLATSTPPHTPVAFSSIICGSDPGYHQIFDFIHRDPNPATDAPIRPFFSTAETGSPEQQWSMSLGNWRLPLTSSTPQLLRRGKPFWDYLTSEGIDTDIYYLPANYPPQAPVGEGRFRCITGMGTPDLLGSYGEFTLFTPDVSRRGRTVGGGRFSRLFMSKHHGTAELVGPPNFLREPDSSGFIESLQVTIDVQRDPEHQLAKFQISDQVRLLRVGEWSDWVPIQFQSGIPGTALLSLSGVSPSIAGMVRIYLKQVHPKLVFYVSPINIDPLQPVSEITVPSRFSQDLAKRFGRFHTLGIPEDTKALSHGALDESAFLEQCESVMSERRDQFRHALATFDQGCLFFYFGASDLLQHMFWRDRDPSHPGRVESQAQKYGSVVDDVYRDADRIVGEALAKLRPEDTLVVLSDHGFTSFRRGFNLNSWLEKNGYIKLQTRAKQEQGNLLTNVAWEGTTAYGLGMNGLYLNLAGREKYGSVRDAQRDHLKEEIRNRLLDIHDGDNVPVIHRVDSVEEIFPGADPSLAPDLVVGYNDGYRASWDTVLGEMPNELIVDNLDRWSGTHLIAADLIPGLVLSNRPIALKDPSILDIAPTILSIFGINIPNHMTGKCLFEEGHHVRS